MTKNTERLSPDRQLSRQDIECLKEAFKLFDCDRDGEITVEELGKVCSIKFTNTVTIFENLKDKYIFSMTCSSIIEMTGDVGTNKHCYVIVYILTHKYLYLLVNDPQWEGTGGQARQGYSSLARVHLTPATSYRRLTYHLILQI